MKYTDAAYGSERINRTFIFHNNRLALVEREDGESCTLKYKGRQRDRAYISELDLTPPKLGYWNHGNSCCYTSRIPMRRDWRQGLRTGTLKQSLFGPKETRCALGSLSEMFGLEHVMKNEYPYLEEALSNVEEYSTSCAFSREFAVDEDGFVIYKSRHNVGKMEGNNLVRLTAKFSYLNESLQDALNGQEVEVQ